MKHIITAMICLVALDGFGRQAAPSSHFNFGSSITGDIQISEIRVPKGGISPSTYYESVGFRGNKGNNTGNGYGGIQESKDRRGNRVHIFSIWHAIDNPKDTANFPYAVHLGHGMKSEYFGGEGVGLKTWKLTSDKDDPLYWDADVWYTHVVRCWPAGKHTYYGFFVRDGKDGVWRHLSTIGVREPNILMTGPNDTFIEDWEGTGEQFRKMHIRNNWRRSQNATWVPAHFGRFSVNFWDLDPGKRSYQFRTNWNAGIDSDPSGTFYFMEIGGGASPQSPLSYPDMLRGRYEVEVVESKPNFKPGRIHGLSFKVVDGSQMEIHWETDAKRLPQFEYEIKIQRLGSDPDIAIREVKPHARSRTIDVSKLDFIGKPYSLSIGITDIFGNKSKEMQIQIEPGAISPE